MWWFRKKPEPKFTVPSEWLEYTEKKILAREQKTLALVQEHVAAFNDALGEQLEALEAVDLSDKNVGRRAKVMVKTNIENYVRYVREFAAELHGDSLEDFVERINAATKELQKKTHVPYQKITYLVGKEIAATQKNIASLSQNLKKTVDEELILTARKVRLVKEYFEEKEATEKLLHRVTAHIVSLEKGLKKQREDEKTRIAALQKSKEFLQAEEHRKELRRCEQLLSKELVALKSLVDFKALGKVFHGSKKMPVVTRHKNDFPGAFGDGKELQSLLREAKLDARSEKIASINAVKARITELRGALRNAPVVHEQVFSDKELVEERKKRKKLATKIDELDESLKELITPAGFL